jgi:hypothetical protein
MSVAGHFEKIQIAYSRIKRITSPRREPSLAAERFLRFSDTLGDLKLVCERYDTHFGEWQAAEDRLWHAGSKNEFFLQLGGLSKNLRLDVRSFYIFGKIPFISFSAVLSAMGDDRSKTWNSARKFIKLVKRESAPAIFQEFNRTFSHDMRWFLDHMNLYRNTFIEHPLSHQMPVGMVYDGGGARLTGLTGRVVTEEDEILISQIESDGAPNFPILSTLPTIHSHRTILRYFNVCKNLEKVPEQYWNPAIEMIHRVGLESGELEPLTARLCEMYAGFILFFAERINSHQMTVGV